jgi:methylase of polypeptide subunit release factors
MIHSPGSTIVYRYCHCIPANAEGILDYGTGSGSIAHTNTDSV